MSSVYTELKTTKQNKNNQKQTSVQENKSPCLVYIYTYTNSTGFNFSKYTFLDTILSWGLTSLSWVIVPYFLVKTKVFILGMFCLGIKFKVNSVFGWKFRGSEKKDSSDEVKSLYHNKISKGSTHFLQCSIENPPIGNTFIIKRCYFFLVVAVSYYLLTS